MFIELVAIIWIPPQPANAGRQTPQPSTSLPRSQDAYTGHVIMTPDGQVLHITIKEVGKHVYSLKKRRQILQIHGSNNGPKYPQGINQHRLGGDRSLSIPEGLRDILSRYFPAKKVNES